MPVDTDQILTGDCLALMRAMPAGCVDLAFADPPYNIGYDYDVYKDRRPRGAYLAWAAEWTAEVARLLKPAGSLFVAIGDEYAAEHKLLLDGLKLTMRNWLIWHYTFGVYCDKKFGRSHAHVLYYVKGKKGFTFNADAVRVPSARQTRYNDRRANPEGRVPPDVWEFPRVCGTFRERTGHPCQISLALMERIVKACSNPGDLVLDPFAGSGTTLVAAKKLGRRWLGFELSEAYAEAARGRLEGVAIGGQ